MTVEIRLLGPNDTSVLERRAEDVFDEPISPELTSEFLHDDRHHVVVGIEDGVVVGMATGVHYVHPDKPAQLFINEVGVASSHRERGIGRGLIERLVRRAEELGCTEAWVLTDRDNTAARRLYESAGAEAPPDDCVMYTFRLTGKPANRLTGKPANRLTGERATAPRVIMRRAERKRRRG